ncbi:MAG: SDR family oxidoreductase [Ferrovibrio sp.]|uniref:SDR family oxidoreductase n=1 Tax=Ferrovibrio sp. TaxID=1917215 RepID=UPI00260FD89C|nr:SDR family oxidoreductase [Ferrovibrio sp.]MCW0233819.1 SDR family oxidoreductase [Ferrovibrio sp.]
MTNTARRPKDLPPQHQDSQPGSEGAMTPEPQSFMRRYKPAGKLVGRVAVVSGGDSGIGRAVAIGFAKEGADIAILYLDEHEDAKTTKIAVESEGRRCLLFCGDIADRDFINRSVEEIAASFGHIDILVNNAGEQHVETDFAVIDPGQWERTFRTNLFGSFHLTQAVLPHLKKGAAIINTTSITAFRGQPTLIDYSATKGAMLAFTRSLAMSLVKQGIRVNAVAPGPIWTPLIPASFPAEHVAEFGKEVPMQRPGQPDEVAPAYIFLASDDASYMSGQTLHVNGGVILV